MSLHRYLDIKNTRALEIKYLPPTNHRGSRIKISDNYREQKESKTFSYCYETGSMLEQAVQILQNNGIEIICRASTVNSYIINIYSWGEDYFNIKNLK